MRFHGQVVSVYYRVHVEKKQIECECFDDDSDDDYPIKESI